MSHARLSCSAAYRWLQCPYSVQPVKGEQKSSPAAIDGTHSHTLLENCINLGVKAVDMIGTTMSDKEGFFVVEEDRALRVQTALDYIDAATTDRSGIKAELKLNPGSLINRNDIYGTADVLIVTDNQIEVIDYKDGIGDVQPDSPQLKLYGVGAVLENMDSDGFCAAETVVLTIIQPKSGGVKSYETTPSELMTWMLETVKPAAILTDDPNPSQVPGDHCKWCNFAGNCAGQAKQALEGAQIMFENVGLAEQSAKNDPKGLSDEKIREVLEAKPVIMEFLKGVEKEAFKRFESGHTIEGLKMVYSGAGRREWSLEAGEMEKVLRKLGVPAKLCYVKKLVSPAQAEKLTWENTKGKQQLTDRKLDKLKDEFIKKNKGSKLIVAESDRREAIVTDAATMFQEVNTIPEWLKTGE